MRLGGFAEHFAGYLMEHDEVMLGHFKEQLYNTGFIYTARLTPGWAK